MSCYGHFFMSIPSSLTLLGPSSQVRTWRCRGHSEEAWREGATDLCSPLGKWTNNSWCPSRRVQRRGQGARSYAWHHPFLSLWERSQQQMWTNGRRPDVQAVRCFLDQCSELSVEPIKFQSMPLPSNFKSLYKHFLFPGSMFWTRAIWFQIIVQFVVSWIKTRFDWAHLISKYAIAI